MIDPTLVDTFERDGFLILPNILDAQQIDQIIAVGDRLVASDLRTMRQSKDDGRYDGFRNCIALDPAFMQLLAHPAILPYLVRLLGPGIQLLTSHLIYQQSEPADAIPSARTPGWHRDFAKVLQLLGGLDAPEGFDFNYDTAPLRTYAATHSIPGPYA